jgi:ADP-ribose pyrophosphatase YjhB (NUDIX family)
MNAQAADVDGGHEPPSLVTVAVVLQIRDGHLETLLWQRARDPDIGHWALPGGAFATRTSLEESVRGHLAAKVDVRELAHLEQLETLSDPGRHPDGWQIAAAYLGLIPADHEPKLPDDTAWHPVDDLPPMAFDHASIVRSGVGRLRAKLSYTNLGFAIAPDTFTLSELRDIYAAALGRRVSSTNLERVLVRRGVLESLEQVRRPTAAGGRPPRLFRFRARRQEITDPFAILRPR